MALGFYFHGAAVTTAQYDEAVKRLEAAGAGTPRGASFTRRSERAAACPSTTSGSPRLTSTSSARP